MLRLLPAALRDCERISRRSFLELGALTGLGISLPMALSQKRAQASPDSSQSDVNCILIWTHGGTSHHDTFDPKPEAPLAVRGEFGFINTAVPGVTFCDTVPNMARELGRYALLRSWNPMNASHGHADQWVMSGRQFNPGLHYPCYGSVVSQQFGFKTVMPPFMQLGESIDRRFGGGSAGILGLSHNPFEMLADPNAQNFTVRDITPPGGITSERIDRRKMMLSRIDDLQREADIQPAAYEALDEHFKAALDMITSPATRKAFELESEDAKLRDAYGRTRFGQSCLLSRRLIEAGVRFVTITDSGWDTHQDNFNALKKHRLPPVDQGFPQLVKDLDDHGLLDTTLVVWVTDFGRTPQINSASGRDHWASAGFAIMAGADVPGGAVLGETDGEGSKPTRDEYFTDDLGATIYAKLGLPHDLTVTAPDGRPVVLNEGKVIKEWM